MMPITYPNRRAERPSRSEFMVLAKTPAQHASNHEQQGDSVRFRLIHDLSCFSVCSSICSMNGGPGTATAKVAYARPKV